MKFLVIPTTDWTGHPVPNRLNFIFDRLAERHEVDICHFKIFQEKRRETRCQLIEMDSQSCSDLGCYYIKNFIRHTSKISDISSDYDAIISANIMPTVGANLQKTPIIIDYLDHLPQSAASYYKRPMNKPVKKIVEGLTHLNIKKAEGLITPTLRFKKHLRTKVDKKIKVVPNGLDLDKIGPTDPSKIREDLSLGKPVLGYVGSLEKWIDLENIIEIMPLIKKDFPDANLLIVGPKLHTDYSRRLKRLSKKKGVEDDIIFTGRIDYERLSPYISAMDVGLNPRKPLKMNTLTMGSKVLTYLACGIPVLSKNMPETEERFEGKGVYRYGSDEEFLTELSRCLTESVDPSVVNRYDWDPISKEYEKSIYDILN